MTLHELIFCSKFVSKMYYDKCNGKITLLQQKMGPNLVCGKSYNLANELQFAMSPLGIGFPRGLD